MSSPNDSIIAGGYTLNTVDIVAAPVLTLDIVAGVFTVTLSAVPNADTITLQRGTTVLSAAIPGTGGTFADAEFTGPLDAAEFTAFGVNSAGQGPIGKVDVTVTASQAGGLPTCVLSIRLGNWSQATVANLEYPDAPQLIGGEIVIDDPQTASPDPATGIITFRPVPQGANVYVDILRQKYTVPAASTFVLSL